MGDLELSLCLKSWAVLAVVYFSIQGSQIQLFCGTFESTIQLYLPSQRPMPQCFSSASEVSQLALMGNSMIFKQNPENEVLQKCTTFGSAGHPFSFQPALSFWLSVHHPVLRQNQIFCPVSDEECHFEEFTALPHQHNLKVASAGAERHSL